MIICSVLNDRYDIPINPNIDVSVSAESFCRASGSSDIISIAWYMRDSRPRFRYICIYDITVINCHMKYATKYASCTGCLASAAVTKKSEAANA